MGIVIEILATLLGLSCVFFAGRGKIVNFWIGYAYNIVLFILFMNKALYSSMILQPISLAINIVGHYRWTHPKEGEKDNHNQLKVTKLSHPSRMINLVVVFFLAFVWGWIIHQGSLAFPNVFQPANQPYLDAFLTVMILTAQYLSAQKKIECWVAWTTVNVGQIVLYLLAGMTLMPIVSLVYLILAYFGFKSWKKSMLENE